MKRFARWAFDTAAAVSLALGIIAIVGWAAGRPGWDSWHFALDTGMAGSTQHDFEIVLSGASGFSYRSNHWTRWSDRQVVIPYLALIGLLAVTPALWLRWPTPRRAAKGLCPACGYDFRATPARCPECGTMTGDEENGHARGEMGADVSR